MDKISDAYENFKGIARGWASIGSKKELAMRVKLMKQARQHITVRHEHETSRLAMEAAQRRLKEWKK